MMTPTEAPCAGMSEDFARLEKLVLNLKGADWQKLGDSKQEELVETCFRYWRTRGFPHYELSEAEIKREYQRLERACTDTILVGDEIRTSMAGVRLANCYHPQMWSVRVNGAHTPSDRFNSDEKLRLVIRRALHVWAGRNAVNECNLRSMLRIFSNTTRVSNFRPTAAKAIFENYSAEGDAVLDFSAGYGGRLLGCMPLKRHYIGIDPCTAQVQGLTSMVSSLGRVVSPKARATIHHACAEDILPTMRSRSVSLVFSSPPYFNKELYSTEDSQSYIRYPSYDMWLTGFVEKVLCESWRVLKPGGHVVLNVADVDGRKLTEDVLRLSPKIMQLKRIIRLRLGHKPYLRNRTGQVYKHEPVFVFEKSTRP